MKSLLRSCIYCTPQDDPELLVDNYHNLVSSPIEFKIAEDKEIWNEIRNFVIRHNHVPNLNTLRSLFDQKKELSVLDRLDEVAIQTVLVRGDFIAHVETITHDQRVFQVHQILKDAMQITNAGLEIKQGKKAKHLQGPTDAIRHILEMSHEIVRPTLGAKLSGDIIRDTEDFKREYENTDPNELGCLSGLQQMDELIGGAKRGELWTHAGYTSHGKSLLAMNWAYNQAIYFKNSVFYLSAEMPYPQIRRNIIAAMHSFHEKFKEARIYYGLQDHPQHNKGLDYQKIQRRLLNFREEEFLFNYVLPDLEDESNNYGAIHVEGTDPDKPEYTVRDLQSKAELVYSKIPFEMLIVDHMGLMNASKWVSSRTDRDNEVVRDMKKLAGSFNRGAGMAVLGLFQINREGFKRAEKMREKTGRALYDPTSLAYANECEKSSDIITTVWKDDELVKNNRIQLQQLKMRDGPLFDPFLARVEWSSRRVLTCLDPIDSVEGDSTAEIDL